MGVLPPGATDETNTMGLLLFTPHDFVFRAVRRSVNRNRLLQLVAGCALAAVACVGARDDTQSPPLASAGERGEVSEPVGGAAASPGVLWCEARAVLQAKCQRCHGEHPSNGAPFSLVTYEDTQAANGKGKPRFELIAEVVASEFMPPQFLKLDPAVEPLSESERAALLDWAAQSAPDGACD